MVGFDLSKADSILYKHDDLAPIDCNECRGCSKCCKNMGESIVQDPYDLWVFCKNMKLSGGEKITFDVLISEDGPWILSEQRRIILPSLKMVDNGVCPFIRSDGRCSIHSIRSGLCRLFPLARVFQVIDDSGVESLSYCVLPKELGCHRVGKKEPNIVIKDWIGIPDIARYEEFQIKWHGIKKAFSELCEHISNNEKARLQHTFLDIFYKKPYQEDFYEEFNIRYRNWQNIVNEKT